MNFQPGLKDVIAAKTRLSSVNGEAGELVIAGFRSRNTRKERRLRRPYTCSGMVGCRTARIWTD